MVLKVTNKYICNIHTICAQKVFCYLYMLISLICSFDQAASYPHIEGMLEGIILTSPALRVKPAHPIVGVSFYCLMNSPI